MSHYKVNVVKKIITTLLVKEKKKFSWEKSNLKQIVKLFILLESLQEEAKCERRVRRVWVKELITEANRIAFGASDNLIPTLLVTDPQGYRDFLRMPPQTFELLLQIVGPMIAKSDAVRSSIPAKTRLEITIRYLASGDKMQSIAKLFRVSPAAVHNIVLETCKAIHDSLKPVVFKRLDEAAWKNIAYGFESRWNFDHCIGAIDSKLIRMQAPPHSGSYFYDYKGHHSIHLLGCADAFERFIMVDIGAAGRQSDGGVFQNSDIGEGLMKNTLNVPPPEPVCENGPPLPYVMVGDEAFALNNFMMRPYPRSTLKLSDHLSEEQKLVIIKKRVFNYRLSRARRIIESAFGTLVAVWQILKSPLNTSLPVSFEIVKASVCLHNFIITFDEQRKRKGQDDHIPVGNWMIPRRYKLATTRREIIQYREDFAEYFVNNGAVSFQWEKAIAGDF